MKIRSAPVDFMRKKRRFLVTFGSERGHRLMPRTGFNLVITMSDRYSTLAPPLLSERPFFLIHHLNMASSLSVLWAVHKIDARFLRPPCWYYSL